MKNAPLYRRVLSVVLVIAMIASFLVPWASAEEAKKVTAKETVELTLTPIDPGTLETQKRHFVSEDTLANKEEHALTDVVRVSIVLDKASTLDAGFKADNIVKNASAMAYRDGLRADQAAVTKKIESKIGGKLDVKWNLTLAANIISANVLYGQIDTIKGIDGVTAVFLENRYEPQVDEKVDEPNNGSAAYMIGANLTWGAGYYGAGSKVAIIDTGAQVDHQSFSGEGLEYALAQTAEEKGMTYDEYVATLNLLTPEYIEQVKGELNANIGSGAAAYRNTKIGYGYNYVDKNVTNITHATDQQGDHGSHVSGIATANRFIEVDGEFQPAMSAVGTQGVAPDAQLVVMKVFGSGGGAYDSDYMVAIEDAIVLGCDSANLSLGSGSPGFSFSNGYEDILNSLVENGTVVAFSAGNSGMWYDSPKNAAMQYPYLYIDDVNFATNGSPGSFTNSLATASVDNLGQTGMPLIYGDRHVFYSQTSGYGNEPIATIAGPEYEYVLLDNVGVDDNDHVGQEGDYFAALGSDVLTGKVAMCYRGSSSFFAKCNAAVAQGAVAVVIINNQAGVINMNLTGYNYTAPAVSILKADGDAIKADSEAVTDEEGNVLYYKGTMSIGSEIEVSIPEPTDVVTVSSFSSFGVPGSLVLKPEIMAPGGSIYSVYGYGYESGEWVGGADQYTVFSGTSMASPQVAGMAAVMGQYIRENNLCEATGLSQRQLTNSLLMSTAHPVFDSYGEYHPVIRVGSGLANVGDAVAAKSYILMDEDATMFPDSARDGKVKAELGDDPERTGKYDFSFTVYPMEGSKEFNLRTDLFVQDYAGNAGYGMLSYTGSASISSIIGLFGVSDPGFEVSYDINGEPYEEPVLFEADVNGDGKTDDADAQAILDYLSGALAEGAAFDEVAADVDGDKAITTYDAKLILDAEGGEGGIVITEPTEVTVHLQLTDLAMYCLEYLYNGTYIQGYTFVEPVADEEGNMDVVHSIPILAFFGSFTDNAMLDRTSVIDEAYGTGKLPYVGTGDFNYLSMKSPDGETYTYMGNPYMIEDEFPVERLAMNSEATIVAFNYLPIRNIATLGFAVTDENGKVLTSQATPTMKFGAYYYVNGGTWQNTSAANYNVGKKLSAAGVKEGDVVTVGFYALPEYYGILNAKNNGEVATTGSLDNDGFKAILESGIVGEGAGMRYTVTIDDTAPEVKGALLDLITGDITIRAQDNEYIAYVAVTNKSGSKIYMEGVPEQEGPGELVELPLELPEGETLPNEAVLLVGDYAGNEVAFKVNLGGSGSDEQESIMLGFLTEKTTAAPGSGNRVWEIEPDALWYNHNTGAYAGLSTYANVDFAVTAAEFVDGYVFMAADDGYMYAAELGALDEAAVVGPTFEAGYIYDMAFNYQNNQLYLLGEDNTVYRMHVITGELTKVAVVTLPGASGAMNRLAIDDNGVFYTSNANSPSSTYLYKFVLEGEVIPEDPVDPGEPVDPGDPGEAAYAWDFETEPTDWTFVDSDGDGYNWYYHYNTGSGNHTTHSGSGLICSESYSNDAGAALTPDNWAISPVVDLSAADEATLSVWAVGQDASWASEVFALYAGTSADPASMTKVAGDFTATSSYVNYTADLSDFLGEDEVYVAIRHYNVTDMFVLNIDDVEILVTEAEEGDATNASRSGSVVASRVYDFKGSDNAIVGWDFETEPTDWTFVDSDGDGNNWYYHVNTGSGNHTTHSGDGVIYSESYVNNGSGGGTAVNPDNWAISPAFDLTDAEAATLSVWAVGQDPSWASEVFALYAGTSADPASMTKVAGDFTATGEYVNYTADLSDFLGEDEVYVAIRHYNVTDMFILNIDDVEILGEAVEPIDPEPIDPEPIDPEPAVVLEITAEKAPTNMGVWNYANGGSMAWDHDNDILYLASNYNATQDYDHYLWIVDTETGVAARANEIQGTELSSSNPSARLYGSVRGLVIVPGTTHVIHPTDVPTGLEVTPGVLNLFKGQSAELKAAVYPWTLTNKDVIWTSADESIATVKDGVVTGVEEGETVIIVAADADPTMTVEVPVTVSVPPEAHLRGIIWDENGKGQASEFDSNATEEWTALAVVGQFRWGARVDDVVYGSTADTMYAFDADTYEVTQLGGIVSMWIPSDADELPQDFRDAFAAMGYAVGPVIGPNNNGTYLTMLDPEAGSLIYFDLSDTTFGSDPMATFTLAGRGVYSYDGDTDDNAAIYYGLTESGELYEFALNHEGSITWNDMGNTGIDLTGVSDATNSVWASSVYDAENEFLYLSHYDGADDYAYLYAIDINDLSRVGKTGNFNADVWPVTGLYEYEPATDLVLKVNPDSLVLFEGETAELNIKVKLGDTNEYTVEVADESVCTFADGIVTAVKEGETVITVTTVDVNAAGEHLSVEVPVKVKGFKSVDMFVSGQVTDANGARFTKISLDGAVVSKKGIDAPGNVQSGGRGGNIYVADVNGTPNVLDAETFEPNLEWNEIDLSMYPEYPAMDFANYPTYLTPAGVAVNDKILMTLELGWLVQPTYTGWNLSSFIPDLAAAAFGGLYETDDGTLIYTYYLLGANGDLYYMGVDFTQGRRTDPEKILSTGITLATQNDASMTFLATAKVNPDGTVNEEEYENAGLVIADNGTKKLWYIDFMTEDEDDVVGLIGIMDVENVSGLFGTFDELDSIADIQGIEPFDPGPEPEDPGEYPEPAEGCYNQITVWDFETDPEAAGWTFFDRDADGNNWIWTPQSDFSSIAAHGGVGMILSQSYINNVGAQTPDNFAISPAIDLSDVENANFTFYAKGQDPSYASEVFAVYAGTTNVPGEMIKITPDFTATGSWALYEASLADFAGEPEVYVAIRHYNVTDMYMLDVDDAAVMAEGGEAPPEPVPPVYEWSFENETDLDGWTFIDNDGDNKSWTRYSATGVATELNPGTSYVLSATYNGSAAVDDLAITPALDFSELDNATLSFWVMKNSSTYNENISVYIGTSANLEEMEELVPETATVNAWTNMTADLADYVGEPEVYIAFRHTAAADQFRIYIDAIQITTISDEEPEEPEPTELEDGYYLIGLKSWDVEDLTADDLFASNPENEGEFFLDTTLAEGDEFKVVKITDNAIDHWAWDGGNYVVTAEKAGNVRIYFRETYQDDWGGYIWINVNNEEPAEPFETIFWGFETEAETADWTMLDLDENDSTFHYTSGYNYYEGQGYLVSSWGYPVDDWAITPAIDLSNAVAPEFSLFCRDSGTSEEHVAVYVGSEPTVEAMTQLTDFIAPDVYEETVVDLTAYAGQTVYLGIRHYETDDGWNLFVDNASVREHVEDDGNAFKQPAAVASYDFIPMKAAPAKTLGDGYGRLDTARFETSVEMTKVGETANEKNGGLNAIRGEVVRPEFRLIEDETTVEDNSVNVILTEDEAVTNGLFTVTYDANKLTFAGLTSDLEFKSFSHEINEPAEGEPALRTGVITFAYAAKEEIPAETALATLNFTYEGDAIDTTVVVAAIERNDDLELDESLVIEIKVGELPPEPPVEEDVYELIDVLKDGEKVVVVNSSYNKALSNEVANNYYLAGKDVEPVDEKIVNPEASIVWTVVYGEDGVSFEDANGNKVALVIDGRYTNLKLEGEDNVWALEPVEGADRTYFVRNTTAKYNDKDQYLEWYASKNYFSGYGMQADTSLYTFQFYAKTEGGELPPEPPVHDCQITQFEDVMEAYPDPENPYHQAIEWAFTHEPEQITSGMNETTFGVGGTLTRAQAATFLYAAAGKPEFDEATAENPFKDVKLGKWYTVPVLWAYSQGLVSGMSADTYGINSNLTRGQIMVILYAWAGKPSVEGMENPYTDVPAGKWYTDAAIWAANIGLEKGEDGKYVQSTPCYREVMVLYLYRYLEGKCLAE